MPAILPFILTLLPALSKTTCRQLHCIVDAMLAMTGRVTQLGLSRWTPKGGSYRTIPRFFHTKIDWLSGQTRFFERFVYQKEAVYILAGDESPIAKAGKHTYGREWFYSSIRNKTMAGLSFFSFALINVADRHAFSLSTEQIVRSPEEKEQAKRAKLPRKQAVHATAPKPGEQPTARAS